jgi:putative peptidoglycan lipid II flippase
MAPLLLGTGIYQLNILLSRLLASHLPEGAQSYLYYGQRLVEIPQGMLAVAVASASLPTLSRMVEQGQLQAAKDALRHGLSLTLFLAIPSSLALAALAVPTITVLFGRGHFDAEDATLTAHALVYMAAGVWAVSSVQNVTRMFYALGDTRTPVVCSAINLVTFLATSVALIPTLQHSAIALANSVAAVVQLGVLVVRLRARIGALGLRELGIGALRSLACAAAMAIAAQLVVRAGAWHRGGNDPENLLVYAAAVVAGLATYVLASLLLRSPELKALGAALRRGKDEPSAR